MLVTSIDAFSFFHDEWVKSQPLLKNGMLGMLLRLGVK